MQDSLFDGEYQPDKFVIGSKLARSAHENHENKYMQRPFIFWDGEGYTDEYGFHHYWLLANSCGDKIIAPPGRTIERASIARMFARSASQYPDANHCGFALGYDFTCILRSNGMSESNMTNVYANDYFTADGYVWRLMMGKMLSVFPDNQRELMKFTLQDVWGFFQRSFIKALDEYFDKDWPYREVITEMKAKRAHFDREHDDEVMLYNDYELELGVMLMEELRDRLYTAGMPIRDWYGPGALASGLMSKWKIKDKITNLYEKEPEVAEASRYAYAGGRFELVKPGHINGPVYQYDINSAYPWAIAQLPNLADGQWKYLREVEKISDLPEFSVAHCRVDYDTSPDSYVEVLPFPLWRRSPQGRISYPANQIEGWFWKPEMVATENYCRALYPDVVATISLIEAWAYYPRTDEKPFSAIPVLYENRQKLKAIGSGAHVGIKLALNSMYGKVAQQAGWRAGKKHPPYHNLAAAGYVTAKCRAKIIDVMTLNPAAVIATETDAVFSTEPLDLAVSNKLGEFELTQYDDMYYFASGFRFGIRGGETVKPATRGIPVKDISLDAILDQCRANDHRIVVNQTQFISMRWALAMNHPEQIGQWKTTPKEMRLMCEHPHGKRVHAEDCPECTQPYAGIRIYQWNQPHWTTPQTDGAGVMNTPHKVAWVNASPIDELARELESGYMFNDADVIFVA